MELNLCNCVSFSSMCWLSLVISQGFRHQQNIAATMSTRYHQRGGNAESSDGKNAQSLPKRKEIKLKKSLLSQLRQLHLRLWSRFLP